jgi:hypothetical protein
MWGLGQIDIICFFAAFTHGETRIVRIFKEISHLFFPYKKVHPGRCSRGGLVNYIIGQIT